MVIDTITSPSQPQEQHGEASRDSRKALTFKLTMLEKQFVEDRVVSIKDKIEKNGKYLQRQLSAIISTLSRSDPLLVDENTTNMLSSRIKHPLQKFSGFSQGLGEEDHIHNNDVLFTRSLKIPYVERLPPYTFWIHLARNHRMTEDDSVIGKRRIYYDHHGGEALICSDNEEELREHQEVKHDYSHDEDQIIWVAFEEHGSTKEVLDVVKDFVGGTKSEIQERYINLKEQNMRRLAQHSEDSGECGINLDQSLSAALDTFDQLFCRQCLILDCPLHGCSQPLIYPSEKQSVWSELDGDKKPCSDHCYLRGFKDGQKDVTNEIELKQLSNSMEGQVHEMLSRTSDWKPLEKDLYLKGVEMFGRNSCLIYRNLLSGLKTCMEVASYMNAGEGSIPQDINGNINANCTDHEMPSRSRSQRKRGKPRKFKYSSKSGLPSMWKRITTGKNQSERQYTPCGCQGMCGKECPCLLRGSCCEKYCGCSKLCRNRFRGCHCAKSQCKSRQCPCFAAQRECDPDVCRNCWVSCGDGSLGEPPRHGDGQCGNMKILLRQKQRILLARSDVAGWGAFLKNPANKNDYLGEYTGELVSQIEAEKRGKIYDRENFSFLFNLNDQYVLDAYRKGDKLKFANHSSKPNCLAKVMFVAGDHRVGIFAKERIEAGEELFYNYNYGPEHLAKLLDEESRRDKSLVSQGKGKKHQSH